MANRIRVLFTIGAMTGGGSERQMIGILKHLDRERFEAYLYLIYRRGELLPEIPDDVRVIAFGDRRRLPAVYFPGRIHRLCVADMAHAIREHSIDVVYDRTFHMTLIAAGATRKTGVKRVSVVVTDPTRDFERIAGRFRFLKYRVLRNAYRNADRALAVSDGVRTAAAGYYRLPDATFTTHYNSIDLARIDRLVAEDDRNRSPAAQSVDEGFLIVTAGRLHEQKGMIHLLESAHELVHNRGRTRIRVMILGEGPLENVLKDFVDTHRLDRHVSFMGYRANPIPFYRSAKLFVLPSLYEGMPNALIEAMACRVPVLATDCPSGPTEVLDGGNVGRLVPIGDAHAIADAIEDAIDNYGDWLKRVPAARERIERLFAPEVGIRELERQFLDICSNVAHV